jgi:hypothetical protein
MFAGLHATEAHQESLLWEWHGDDLVVRNYSREHEEKAQANAAKKKMLESVGYRLEMERTRPVRVKKDPTERAEISRENGRKGGRPKKSAPAPAPVPKPAPKPKPAQKPAPLPVPVPKPAPVPAPAPGPVIPPDWRNEAIRIARLYSEASLKPVTELAIREVTLLLARGKISSAELSQAVANFAPELQRLPARERRFLPSVENFFGQGIYLNNPQTLTNGRHADSGTAPMTNSVRTEIF